MYYRIWIIISHFRYSSNSDVLSGLLEWFEVDRIRSAMMKLEYFCTKKWNVFNHFFKRKTCKSLIQPCRNKGWKGKR